MFTVVTVVKDDVEGLRQTRRSLERQTFTAWQHVIVCAPSGDGTESFARSFAADRTLTIIQAPQGVYAAMNAGLSECTQQLVNFMNAGDEFYDEDCLRIAADRYLTDGYRFALFGSIKRGHTWSIHLGPAGPASQREFAYAKIAWIHQAAVFETSLLREIGGFNERFVVAADYDLMLRAWNLAQPALYPHPLARFTYGGLSTTRQFQLLHESRQARLAALPFTTKEGLFEDAWFSYRLIRTALARTINKILYVLVGDDTPASVRIRRFWQEI